MKHRLVHLDCLRGLAALLVCAEHLRAFLFVGYEHAERTGILVRMFYFITGLGHQAVMIFFVMSGFLVGGSVISAHQNGKWSWGGYALRRMTRLWVVLLPALLLTLLWDGCGEFQSAAGYRGDYRPAYNSGPSVLAPADLRPITFLGNTLFFQTIAVNVYGTNDPLWSLANEFWYYLLFPLLLGIFLPGRWPGRVACVGLAAMVLMMLPQSIIRGGLVWLFGVGAFVLAQNETTRRWARHPLWLAGSGVLVLKLLAVGRTGRLGDMGDWLLGAACALLVTGLATRTSGPGIYARIAAGVSEFSYTLYLVHFPFLAFLFYGIFKGQKLAPEFHTALLFTVILLLVLAYASIVWWCFERNTDRIRKKLEPLFFGRKSIV